MSFNNVDENKANVESAAEAMQNAVTANQPRATSDGAGFRNEENAHCALVGLEDIEDAQETEENKSREDEDEGGAEFIKFALRQDMLGYILRSTLYRNRKRSDCRMLCRFCGIDVGDGLTAKIDANNEFYDSKTNTFTFLREYMLWSQFAIFKHWIRTGDLNVIGVHSEAEQLQRVCDLLGMDDLSKELYRIQVVEFQQPNPNVDVKYENPGNPKDDSKQQYLWWKQADNLKEDRSKEIFMRDARREGYMQVGPYGTWWRKPKRHQ